MATKSATARPLMTTINKVVNAMARPLNHIVNGDDSCCDVCPPKHKCPERCLSHIHRHGRAGERIIIPFKIKNVHCQQRTYRVGVRPLKEDNGDPAPHQPVLNKEIVTLEPNQTILVEMTVDLKGFESGHLYSTEIVIRENKFNQNICFELCVEGFCDVAVVEPWDECSVYKRSYHWNHHCGCPPKKKRSERTDDEVEVR